MKEVQHPVIGTVRLPAAPVKLNHKRPDIHSAPPVLGEHSKEILSSILGLSEESIQGLFDENVIG